MYISKSNKYNLFLKCIEEAIVDEACHFHGPCPKSLIYLAI